MAVKMQYNGRGKITLLQWCMDNGARGEKIKAEWTGMCKGENKRYSMGDVAPSTHKRFKWHCQECGYEWYALLNDRTRAGHNCPACAGRAVTDKNSLLQWCIEHGEQGARIRVEWTGIRIDGKCFSMEEVSYGQTSKKFKWVCSRCGHVWWTAIRVRTCQGGNCPICSHKIITQSIVNKALEKGSLLDWCRDHGVQGVRIKTEWTGIDIDGNKCSMEEVSYGSHKRLTWECMDCGYRWDTEVRDRTSGHNCPSCAGIIVTDRNNLDVWCKNHGIWGERLRTEFTGICIDGQTYGIHQVAAGSNKKLLWHCRCGHTWYATINSRTCNGCSCPSCSKSGTSYPEQFIYWCLKQLYPKAENRFRVLKDAYRGGLEFDIGIPDIPLCIEYGATYWHNGREERDQLKREVCKECGVRFIEIIDSGGSKRKETFTEDLIIVRVGGDRDKTLEKIVSYILNQLGHSIDEIDIERAKADAYKFSHWAVEYEKA